LNYTDLAFLSLDVFIELFLTFGIVPYNVVKLVLASEHWYTEFTRECKMYSFRLLFIYRVLVDQLTISSKPTCYLWRVLIHVHSFYSFANSENISLEMW